MADNTTILSSSSLVINNEVVEFKAETLEYDLGLGEVKSNMVISGGAAKRIPGTDLSTQFATVKFDVQTTEFNRDQLLTWKRNGNTNAIEVSDSRTGAVLVFQNASLSNNPSVKEASDGVISVEFTADQPVNL